ncbi:MAG: PilZ domain-containing protein [Candidatus Zixiibacteriota bacterium]
MTQDQRKYNRRRVSEYFIVVDQLSNRKIGGIFDMSADGMMLITEYRVDVPLICACRMDLPTKVLDCDQLEFCIEAKWSRKSDLTGIYEVGFQFIHLTDHQKELIQVILDKWTVEEVDEEHPKVYTPDPES